MWYNINTKEGGFIKEIKNKTELMLEIEKREGVSIEEVLRRKFVDENKSKRTIADELSISYVTAFKWLERAGVYSRKLEI